MKRLACFVIICALLGFHRAQAAPADANESGFQLTIELQDGSRVVGKTIEDTLSFRSAALGDMKLPWASIRSIEYSADGTARLTATNGDTFTVQFAADTLPVQTSFGKTELPVKVIRSIKVTPLAVPYVNAPAPGESGWRLTIDLRDGSHVVGKGLDDAVNFHSSAMGDLKLAWSGIRLIEYAGTNTDTARLTATNGDVYEVQFATSAVLVETSFGKTELPVTAIRSIRVSAMSAVGQLPSGLVGLWSGEGNGDDSVGGNNATLTDITFADGKVGQAFSFNDESSCVKIPASPALDVGAGDGFTLTAWVNPSSVSERSPIFEWNKNDGLTFGPHFYIDAQEGGPELFMPISWIEMVAVITSTHVQMLSSPMYFSSWP